MIKSKIILAMLCTVALTGAAGGATRLEKRGDELRRQGKYYEAIQIYAKTFSKKDSSVIGIEGTAECYLRLRNYLEAERWLASRMNRPGANKYPAIYAEVLMYNGKYDMARYVADSYHFAGYERVIAACDSALLWMSEEEPEYLVRPVLSINSVYDDFAAMPYERFLYFCTNRPDIDPKKSKAKSPKIHTAAEFTRVFAAAPILSKSKGVDTIYKPTVLFGDIKPANIVNAKNVNNGPLAYAGGRASVLYYTQSSTRKNKANKNEVSYNLEIFNLPAGLSSGEDGKPNTPVAFSGNNPAAYSVAHPALSSDGKILYFVSDMPGGKGGKDIWYSELDGKGIWGKPTNCGSINTPGDEVFPTINNDMLYFSSNGHAGMGGLDIFMAKGSKNKWQPPVNMRHPINSSADDFYLIVEDNTRGERGYFSSNRAGGMGGDDIYSFAPFIEIQDPTPVDVRISAEYDQPFTPSISMENVGKQPIFPPTVYVKDAAPARITATEQTDEETGAPLTISTINYKTQEPIHGVKVCLTHSATHTSKCKPTNADGRVVFGVEGSAEYIITAFKNNYTPAGPPTRINSNTIIPDQVLPVTMKQIKQDFHDIDKDISKHKKHKSAVGRGQREYRVHVLAIDKSRKLDRSYFDRIKEEYPKMYPPQLYKDSRFKRYTCGSFAKLSEAQMYMRHFIALGYGKEAREKCFVAVFVNGKHVENIYAGGAKQRIK
jgi:hypothetical protein